MSQSAQHLINLAASQLNHVILGKSNQVKLALTTLLAGGHLLLEDLPGMGKTTLAHGLSNVFGLDYKRVQFTSDLLPADVVGATVFDAKIIKSVYFFLSNFTYTKSIPSKEVPDMIPIEKTSFLFIFVKI